jgi:putative addiction module CopG family antidote
MSNFQKVSVSLTPEFMALLKEAVETGEYTSASEVIRDALRYWKARRTHQAMDVEDSGRTESQTALAASSRLMRSRRRPGAKSPIRTVSKPTTIPRLSVWP